MNNLRHKQLNYMKKILKEVPKIISVFSYQDKLDVAVPPEVFAYLRNNLVFNAIKLNINFKCG